MSNRTFLRILEELNYPRVYLISPKQFEMVEGDKIKGSDGIASVHHSAITTRKGLRGKALSNTIYHEIGHHIFPHRPHWWIECYAEKMARGGGRGAFAKLYGHSIDELPSRARLLELSIRATKRFNGE